MKSREEEIVQSTLFIASHEQKVRRDDLLSGSPKVGIFDRIKRIKMILKRSSTNPFNHINPVKIFVAALAFVLRIRELDGVDVPADVRPNSK